MDFFFYIALIVGMSLLYDGYTKKKNTEVEIKRLELEKRKMDLELKQLLSPTESTDVSDKKKV